jgi:hypothetical protein
MATKRVIEIVIAAKDLFSRQISAAMDKVKARMDKFKKHWIAATVAITAAILAVRKAWNLAFEAAQFQQQEQGFANLAASHGAASKTIIANLRRVSAETISTADLMVSAGTAMLLGIPVENLEKMMETARAASRITGESIQKMFSDIVRGVGRQSKLILDNLGIIVSVGKANEEYAKVMGIVGRALTDAESKQAFINATMLAGEEIIRRVNVEVKTSAEAMQAFQARMDNLKVFAGKAIIAVYSFVNVTLNLLSATVASMVGQVAQYIAQVIKLGSALPLVGDRFKAAGEAVQAFAEFEFGARDIAFELASAHYDTGTAIFREAEAIKAVTAAKVDGNEAERERLLAAKLAAEERPISEPAIDIPGKDTVLEGLKAAGITELENKEQLAAAKLAIDRKYSEERLRIAGAVAGGISDFATNMYTILGSKGKAFAKIAKKTAIAQAIIAGYQSAVNAWRSGMETSGPWAPAVAVAYTAMSLAKTGALIAKIGGSQPSSGGGGSTSSISSLGNTPSLLASEQDTTQPASQVNITINNPITAQLGDELGEFIVDLINRGAARNILINDTAIERV